MAMRVLPVPYSDSGINVYHRLPKVREVETMLQDIKVSDQLVAQYEATVAAPQRAAAEAAGRGTEMAQLSFRILNERVWPSYRTPEPLLFPPELTQCLDQLSTFYDNVRAASSGGSGGSQTVVRWVTDQCKAEIVPNYGR